jgi:hypothetical protein
MQKRLGRNDWGWLWKIVNSFRLAQKKIRKFSLRFFLMVVFLSAQVPLTDLRVSQNTCELQFFKKGK